MGSWRNLAVAAAVLPLAACAFQAVGRAPRANGMGRPPSQVDVSEIGVREIEGKVVQIDAKDGRVLVEHKGEVVELHAPHDATVFVEGGVGAMNDVHEGSPVRASFEQDGDKRVIRWIEVPRPANPVFKKVQPVPKQSSSEEKK